MHVPLSFSLSVCSWAEVRRLLRYAYVVLADLGRDDKAAAVVQALVPALCALHEYAEAEQLLRWALGRVGRGGLAEAARGPLTEQLAETLLRAGRAADAAPLYERAVAALESGGRSTVCELATALNNLGLAYAVAGDPAKGRATLDRGLAVAEQRCAAAVPAALVSSALHHFSFRTPPEAAAAAARPLLERAIVLARTQQDARTLGEAQVLLRRINVSPPP
jgi:tetratricopeptide (TPR) repeat protein